jgi:hypothetical protein
MEIHKYKSFCTYKQRLIKKYKADSPVRPIVDQTNDPAYKIARMLANDLEIYILPPYIFNVKNTIQLTKDLDIPFENDLKFIAFDITNMYSNVPVKELIKITEIMCKQNDPNKETSEIIMICKILTKQN